VSHAIEGPRVLDDEEGDPLRFAIDIEENAAHNHGDRIGDEEYYIEHLLMPRGFLVVGDVEQEFFESHPEIVARRRNSSLIASTKT